MTVKAKEKKIDISPESLSGQVSDLTDEQNEAIALEAMKEFDTENLTEEKEEEKEEKEKEQEEKSEEEKEQDGEEKEEETEGEEKEEGEEEKTAEEEKKGEEEEKPKEEEKQEKQPDDITEEQEKEAIKIIMEKENLSEEDAKESFQKDRSIIKKYEGDKLKMARAYRNVQSQASKFENELNETKQYLQQVADAERERALKSELGVDRFKTAILNGELTDKKGNKMSEGDVIEQTRQGHPTITRDMSDEAVIEYAAGKLHDQYKAKIETIKRENTTKAIQKREEIISKLSEKDKKYAPKLKEILSALSDERIVGDSFNGKNELIYVKGLGVDEMEAKHEEELKRVREEAFKKGQEQAKVLGEKAGGDKGAKSKPVKKSDGLSRSLSEVEKNRAKDMFEDSGMEEREMYEAYLEIYPEEPEELKSKKK